MSARDLEAQNDALLDSLAAKVTALRGVTNDIHRHASDHSFITQTTDIFENMGTQIKATSGKLGQVMKNASRRSVMSMVGMILGVLFVLYLFWG
ncbi:hypothetical protein YB2330_000601 [Saitoella coloradoensis]